MFLGDKCVCKDSLLKIHIDSQKIKIYLEIIKIMSLFKLFFGGLLGPSCGTGWHTHKSDQMLVVTAGVGVVADESHEQEITVGDVVHVLQGENHWHGATANSYMSHITITAAE